jgi:uncharacterized membrane protein (GlpM family)
MQQWEYVTSVANHLLGHTSAVVGMLFAMLPYVVAVCFSGWLFSCHILLTTAIAATAATAATAAALRFVLWSAAHCANGVVGHFM